MVEKRVIPLMNLRIGDLEKNFGEIDEKTPEFAFGEGVLYSDGSVRQEYNPNLITKKCEVSDSEGVKKIDIDGGTSVVSNSYSIVGGKLVLDHYNCGNNNSYKSMCMGTNFSLNGLFEYYDVDETVEERVDLLEGILSTNQLGFVPSNMLSKRPETKLAILKNRYNESMKF